MKLKKQLIKIIIKKKLPTEDKGNICNKNKKIANENYNKKKIK